MDTIYFDYAATTPLREEVYFEMEPYLKYFFGNPSAVYDLAKKSRKAVDKAREQVAALLGCESTEIYFTSGGTESDNWALKSGAFLNSEKGRHIITTNIEHHAVLNCCKYLERIGFEVTYLKPDKEGIVSPQTLKESIRDDTILISVMFANNEIGSIQPIKEMGEIAKEHGILFHTDAVQAGGHVEINVKKMNIDMLTMSGHKIYGPKGIGILYVRNGIFLEPYIHGGGQERGMRAGTENVPGIVGIGKASELRKEELISDGKRILKLRDTLIDRLLKIPDTYLNGSKTSRLPGNVNISFDYVEAESILTLLNAKGFQASSASACSAGQSKASHVLLAIDQDRRKIQGALRLTLGKYSKESDIDALMKELPLIVESLRKFSPVYENGL